MVPSGLSFAPLRLSMLTLIYLAVCVPALAAPAGNSNVQLELISDQAALGDTGAAEQSPRIGVLLKIAPEWHIYWQNSGESGLATTVDWKLPAGWRAEPLQWPAPYKFKERGDITTFGYKNELLLFSRVIPPSGEAAQGAHTISAEVTWLACKDICIPGRGTVSTEIRSGPQPTPEPSGHYDLFERYQALTPYSLEHYRDSLDPQPFDVQAIGEHLSVAPGQATSVGLIVTLPKRTGIAQHAQLFPGAHDNITGVHATGAALQVEGAHRYWLHLPLKISAGAQAGTETLGGIVVLSGEAVGLAHDISVTWSVPIKIGAAGGRDSRFAAQEAAGEQPEPLRLRLINAGAEAETDQAAAPPAASDAGNSIWYVLLCAFAGGLLLNLMPCVLPIISIKVMGFVGMADEANGKARLAALAFSLGILSTLILLAGIVVLLKSLGVSLGWGFQFQHPEFVFALLLIVYVLALGFFDVYTISLPYLQGANKAVSKLQPSLAKHFFDGVLATLLSTPCTAPFLGVALVAAFAQSAWVTFLVFITIGLGLAFPYAYLSTHPKLLSLLPRPGAWMYRIRQLMGFFLLATVLWLEFILLELSGTDALWSLAVLLVIYFAFWLRHWARESGTAKARTFAAAAGILLCLFAVVGWYPRIIGEQSQGAISWVAYSPEVIAEAQRSGRSVFIDFTAEWCITCKANELLTIETAPVAAALETYGVLPVKADWTDGNAVVTAALKSYGGEGVPLYVVLSPNTQENPVVLSTLPSSSSLIEAFKQVSMSARDDRKLTSRSMLAE